MALYCLYERTDMDFKRIEPALRKALHDKDSSVVFAALSVWKMILLVEYKNGNLVPGFI